MRLVLPTGADGERLGSLAYEAPVLHHATAVGSRTFRNVAVFPLPGRLLVQLPSMFPAQVERQHRAAPATTLSPGRDNRRCFAARLPGQSLESDRLRRVERQRIGEVDRYAVDAVGTKPNDERFTRRPEYFKFTLTGKSWISNRNSRIFLFTGMDG